MRRNHFKAFPKVKALPTSLLKMLFNIYLYLGVIFVFLIACTIAVFLIKRAFFALEWVDQENTAYVTLLNIIVDLWPAIAGTFLITLFAVIIAIPAGIVTGIFINEYTKGRTRRLYIFFFKLIAGTPSIVIGVFGFVMLLLVNRLFAVNLRTSFLVSGLSLSILVLPYIVHSTIGALKNIPTPVRFSGLSLGAKKYQNIFRILLPEAFVSLAAGIVLSIGRACEDTAVIMLTGVAAYAGIPNRFTSSFEALPFYIYYHTSEYQTQHELTGVFVATVIVIVISGGFIATANIIKNRIDRKLNS